MRFPALLFVLLAGACAVDHEEDDLQQVQQFAKVKGGAGGNWVYNPGANLVSLFGNQSQPAQPNNQGPNQGAFNQQGQSGYNQGQGQGQATWNRDQQGHGQSSYNQDIHGQGQSGHNQNQQGQSQTSWNQNQQGQSQGSYNQHQSGQSQASWNQQQEGQSHGSWNSNQQGQRQGAWNQNQQGQATWHQVQGGQGGYNQQGQQSGQGSYNQQGQQNGQGIYNQQGQQTGYWRHNLTGSVDLDLEKGVCYIEVPTARIAKDPNHVPAGNGSRPDLSVIRSCCQGYIRNIHNFRKCDPVCTQECVNALCTAPETCTCFPDHVKNLAGFCIPTCPIGCQNGQCEGTKCVCKEGFKSSSDGQFCVPHCQENCGGIGNCTSPNTCECKQGYESSKEGSCKPACDKCSNGDCVAPNECKCHAGYEKNQQGVCEPHCKVGYEATPTGCKLVCHGCAHGDCIGPNECRCHEGYVKEQGRCVPHCTPDCGLSSRCVSPNVCDPPRQIQVHQPYNSSQPLYPDSQRGDIGPGQANAGQCSNPCINGVCVGANQCQCNTGYVLDKNDASGAICVPNCPGGCVNGVCSAPNFCICNMGYFKDHSVKGRPSCVKRVRRSAPLNVADLLVYEIPDY